jgi:hypothetical protein
MSYAEELHLAHKKRLERIANRAFVKAKEIRSEARNDPTRSPDSVEFAYEVSYQFMELGAEVAKEVDGRLPDLDIENLRVEGGFAVARIQKAVCRHFNIKANEMNSSVRLAMIVRPRQIAMYLCRTLTSRSLPEIGRRFGGKDHTTVLHGYNKIRKELEADDDLAADIDAIKKELASYEAGT